MCFLRLQIKTVCGIMKKNKIKGSRSEMNLHESAEMYLETIYILSCENECVRSIDVAEHMGYSKPSVSRAVGLLKKAGLLTMEKDGCLRLTEDGKTTAKKVFDRHTVLSHFLAFIGVNGEIATKDACRMEHVISDETVTAIKTFLEKYE